MENRESNFCYMVRCSDGTLYTGWTKDLEKRVAAHNSGKGARYTRSRRPVRLVYYEAFATKEEAMQREYALKQLSRIEKQALVDARKKTASAGGGRTIREKRREELSRRLAESALRRRRKKFKDRECGTSGEPGEEGFRE